MPKTLCFSVSLCLISGLHCPKYFLLKTRFFFYNLSDAYPTAVTVTKKLVIDSKNMQTASISLMDPLEWVNVMNPVAETSLPSAKFIPSQWRLFLYTSGFSFIIHYFYWSLSCLTSLDGISLWYCALLEVWPKFENKEKENDLLWVGFILQIKRLKFWWLYIDQLSLLLL